jgi:membrane complex biogenesis BtpA family protein
MSALGIAAACGLGRGKHPGFVRVNVHCGTYVTDQGVIEGEAYHSLRYRQALAAPKVEILADVLVKHASPLADISPSAATHDCIDRGLADGVIVTGMATGAAVSSSMLSEVVAAAGKKPVLIGSGFSPEQAQQLAPLVQGAFVGTWVKQGGRVENPVDLERVQELVAAVRGRFSI